MKRKFTDRFVSTIKAAPKGKRVEYYDAMVPCFGLRVTDKAHRSYVLYLKFPGAKCATRRGRAKWGVRRRRGRGGR